MNGPDEVRVGQEPRPDRSGAKPPLNLLPRNVRVAQHAYAARVVRPLAREEQELSGENGGLAAARCGVDVGGAGCEQNGSTFGVGEVEVGGKQLKFSQVVRRNPRDDHAAPPFPVSQFRAFLR
ncbi:hypothetical protein SDC9_77886 [bioreactor metagenome]|uniref:Uncharacterized protein n=1 Tax=bioreactor metagenome TaxID=1076179 RepID=A0A644YTZ0_9ZZZZ